MQELRVLQEPSAWRLISSQLVETIPSHCFTAAQSQYILNAIVSLVPATCGLVCSGFIHPIHDILLCTCSCTKWTNVESRNACLNVFTLPLLGLWGEFSEKAFHKASKNISVKWLGAVAAGSKFRPSHWVSTSRHIAYTGWAKNRIILSVDNLAAVSGIVVKM